MIQDLKLLAKRTVEGQSKRVISGDEASALLDPDRNQDGQGPASVIVRINVRLSGVIEANGRQVDLKELGAMLDELVQKQGVVWYSREAPDQEPPESIAETINQVVDAIIQRRLPVKLQAEDH